MTINLPGPSPLDPVIFVFYKGSKGNIPTPLPGMVHGLGYHHYYNGQEVVCPANKTDKAIPTRQFRQGNSDKAIPTR